MTAAVLALAVLASTLAVVLALVARWGVTAKDGEMGAVNASAAEQVAHGETKAELATTRFELETTKAALTDATTRAAQLAKELSDAIEREDPGAGLAAGDVDGRLLRIAAAAQAADAGDPVPAPAGAGVPDREPAPAGGSATADVHAGEPIDVLR